MGKGMLKKLKIPLTGQHHLGMDDVSNLAKILKVMIDRGAKIQPTAFAKNLANPPGLGKGKGRGKGGKGGKNGKDGKDGKNGKDGKCKAGGRTDGQGLQQLPTVVPPVMHPPAGMPPPVMPPAEGLTAQENLPRGSTSSHDDGGNLISNLFQKRQQAEEGEQRQKLLDFLHRAPAPGESWEDDSDEEDEPMLGCTPEPRKRPANSAAAGSLVGVLSTSDAGLGVDDTEEPPAKAPKIASLLLNLPAPRM